MERGKRFYCTTCNIPCRSPIPRYNINILGSSLLGCDTHTLMKYEKTACAWILDSMSTKKCFFFLQMIYCMLFLSVVLKNCSIRDTSI